MRTISPPLVRRPVPDVDRDVRHETLKSRVPRCHRLAKPSCLNVIEQMEGTTEPIRLHHLEISRAFEMSGGAAQIQETVSANQHWQELIKQTTATSHIAEGLAVAHQSWIERIKPMQYDFSYLSQLQAILQAGAV